MRPPDRVKLEEVPPLAILHRLVAAVDKALVESGTAVHRVGIAVSAGELVVAATTDDVVKAEPALYVVPTETAKDPIVSVGAADFPIRLW